MILVTGGNGQVASQLKSLVKLYKLKIIFKNKNSLDITNFKKVEQTVIRNNIKVIINTAALTKVDFCETHKNEAMHINYHSVKNIVNICKKNNILLIHISTDYVYFGKSKNKYSELSYEKPVNVYGLTKLKADKYIKKNLSKFFIIRSGWIFSKYGNNFINFINNNIKSKKSINLISNLNGNPTSALSLSIIIIKLLKIHNSQKNVKYGIYNFCNHPSTTWYQFGKYYIQSRTNIKKYEIQKILSHNLNLPAKRPINTKLNDNKLIKYLNLKKINWKDEISKL